MNLYSSDFRKVYFVISGFAEDFGYDIVPQRDVVVCYSSFCYIYCRFKKIAMLLQTGWGRKCCVGDFVGRYN